MTKEPSTKPLSSTDLALIVRLLRHEKGWSQETLAEVTGLSERTIQRVEDGEGTNAHTHRALARAFGFENINAFNGEITHAVPGCKTEGS